MQNKKVTMTMTTVTVTKKKQSITMTNPIFLCQQGAVFQDNRGRTWSWLRSLQLTIRRSETPLSGPCLCRSPRLVGCNCGNAMASSPGLSAQLTCRESTRKSRRWSELLVLTLSSHFCSPPWLVPRHRWGGHSSLLRFSLQGTSLNPHPPAK